VTAQAVLSVSATTLGGVSTISALTITAASAAHWSLSVPDGVFVTAREGFLAAGASVTITVTDPTGAGAWLYLSAGSTVIPVHVLPLGQVTSTLGL
jgi:hypothetical protein